MALRPSQTCRQAGRTNKTGEKKKAGNKKPDAPTLGLTKKLKYWNRCNLLTGEIRLNRPPKSKEVYTEEIEEIKLQIESSLNYFTKFRLKRTKF